MSDRCFWLKQLKALGSVLNTQRDYTRNKFKLPSHSHSLLSLEPSFSHSLPCCHPCFLTHFRNCIHLYVLVVILVLRYALIENCLFVKGYLCVSSTLVCKSVLVCLCTLVSRRRCLSICTWGSVYPYRSKSVHICEGNLSVFQWFSNY